MPFGRRNPLDDIEELLERMGKDIDIEQWPPGGGVAVDVVDHGDRYVVSADLPGFEKDDIDLRLSTGMLHLSAERETETTEEDVNYLRRERRRSSVDRRVSLPDPVETDGISATYNHGVLTVEIPKQSADDGTRIEVE